MSLPNTCGNGKASGDGVVPPRPVPLAVNPDGIPADLRAMPQWVLWRYEWKPPPPPPSKQKGKWDKVPHTVHGHHASSTDPRTWAPFDVVLAAYQRGGFDGIGLIHLHRDRITGVDGDKCRDPQTGGLQPWAEAMLRELDSYAEASVSGTGVRGYARGVKPGRRCRTGPVEIYDGLTAKGEQGGRFLTLTGHRLPGFPATVNDRQGQIEALYHRTFGVPKEKPAGGKRAKGLRAATYGGDCPLPLGEAELARWGCLPTPKTARVRALWSGDTTAYDSPSEADLALAAFLLILTNGGRQRSEELFGESVLGKREKWTGREDYRRRTFEKAASKFTPWNPDPAAGNSEDGDEAKTAATKDDKKHPAVDIILGYWGEKYNLIFRRREDVFYSANLDREVKSGELLRGNSAVIGRLRGPLNNRPVVFKKWAPVALGDLNDLPFEARSEEIPEQARESFRAVVTRALLTVVALQYRHQGKGTVRMRGKPMDNEFEVDEVQRRPLIDWARQFAKEGGWGDVRGLRVWSRLVSGQLRVRLRVEAFAQVHCAELARLTPTEFSGLCEQYAVGTRCTVDRGRSRAVELNPDFLAEVLARPSPDDAEDAEDRQDSPRVRTREASSTSPASSASSDAGVGVGVQGPSSQGRTEEGREGGGSEDYANEGPD